MGYRRLGLTLEINQDARVDHQWAAAFHWQQSQGKPTNATSLFLVQSQEWTEENFSRWFHENVPEVVLSYDAKVIGWLEKLGKRVPEDIGFVHLWNPDRSGRYAGLYHTPPAIGEAAVNFLIGLLQRNECGIPKAPQTLLLNAVWLDGASLKKAVRPKDLAIRARRCRDS
jgi:LacI family transcriptional regulator